MSHEPLPAALGAERYIITCCLNEPNAVLDIANALQADDFYREIYRHTFQVCVSLVEKEMVPEPMTVYNHLEKISSVEPNNLRELELLARAKYDLNNIQEYIDEIRATSARRQLIKAQEESIEDLMEVANTVTPDESFAICERRILEVGNKLSDVQDVCKIGMDARDILAERASNPVKVVGLPTGFPGIDEEIQGLQGGALYVLAARYKAGKSVFLMNVAANIAINCEVPVLMIDTENPSPRIDDRFLSLLSGVEEMDIRNGMFTLQDGAEERLEEAITQLDQAEIYHHYMPNFTFEACLSLIKRYHVQKGIGLVVFDYIKTPDNAQFSSVQEHQMLGHLTGNLHNKVAGTLDIPVITAAQLGRKAIGADMDEDDHVADSDRIGRYADVLMYFREKTEAEKESYGCNSRTGNMVLTVQTNRNGPSREFAHDIWFDKPRMSMREVKSRRL